jgi:hypothetical protein
MPCCIAYRRPRRSPSAPPSVARNTREGSGKGNGKGKQREDATVTGNEGQVAELRAQLDCNVDTVHHESSALRVDFETHCMDVMSQCAERVTSHYSGRGLSTGKVPPCSGVQRYSWSIQWFLFCCVECVPYGALTSPCHCNRRCPARTDAFGYSGGPLPGGAMQSGGVPARLYGTSAPAGSKSHISEIVSEVFGFLLVLTGF